MTREGAIEAIKCNWPDSRYTILREALDMAVKALEDDNHFREDTKKVEPLVRCRECKHWKPSGSKAGNSFSDMEYIGGCEFTNYCRRESDFCSYGERKEGDD